MYRGEFFEGYLVFFLELLVVCKCVFGLLDE